MAGFRPFGLSPALAWLLLLSALLLALTIGSLVTGGWRPDLAILLGPSPSPAATAVPGEDEGTGILAVTVARPLLLQATCPAGSDPDAPGPAAQARPPAPTNISTDRAMAFDRRSGRIVLLETQDRVMGATAPAHTWTFDVCTNTWERKNPRSEPPAGRAWLAYDADSDRTVALIETGTATERRFETWSYDLVADRWSRGSDTPLMPVPEDPRSPDWYLAYGLLYHDPSGLVVFHDGGHMWAYDLESDTWTAVRRQPDPTLPAEAGLPAGVYLVGYDADRDRFVAYASRRLEDGSGMPETWTFDPGSGTWRFEAGVDTPSIACGWGFAPECGAVFDARIGLTVFLAKGGFAADGYEVGLGAWRILHRGGGLANSDDACDNDTPVYDSVNGRIVCRAGRSGVAVLDTGDGSAIRPWWLLEPLPAASPAP
ncbi:MAG: hypothetical protein H6Q36_1797 [Chloroflexi bacterium]|nr:hypothetical protein [Chloroflexota bacterium]